jgi:hypothetical protein
MSAFANTMADALDAALDGPIPDGPFTVGQRVRRLVRRPVMGTITKIVVVETDDGRDVYDVQGAVVHLDTPDTFLDDSGRTKEIGEEIIDAEDVEDGFWEIVS